jgi:hypothetical protein
VISIVVLVCGNAVADTSQSDLEAIASPSGDFVIVDIRRASDVAGPPEDKSLTWEIGQKLSVGDELIWPDGRTCLSWHATRLNEPVVNLEDPLLSDTQIGPLDSTQSSGDFLVNRMLALRCKSEEMIVLQVDRRVLVASSPSGQSYIIFEKPLRREQVEALQKKLHSMKFMEGYPSGEWADSAQAALSSYAAYRGATFNFHRPAITQNLLDGLDVVLRTGADVLKIVYAGDASAFFYGKPIDLAPPEYGTEQLRFRFKDDKREYAFKPRGDLFSSDWSLDIFAPGEQFIALLQDRYGPYHVMHTGHLKAYLSGEREPDWIVRQPPHEKIGGVHENMKWISPTSLEFTHTCCGDPIGQFWQVPDAHYQLTCTRDVLRLYRPALGARLDQLPILYGLGKKGWESDVEPANLSQAFERLHSLNSEAAELPGSWTEGAVELGAELRQYQPSDAELMSCVAGRELLELLNGKTLSRIRFNWHGVTAVPPPVLFKDLRFRRVEVQGSGLYHFPSAPETIEFGPWVHNPLPHHLVPADD